MAMGRPLNPLLLLRSLTDRSASSPRTREPTYVTRHNQRTNPAVQAWCACSSSIRWLAHEWRERKPCLPSTYRRRRRCGYTSAAAAASSSRRATVAVASAASRSSSSSSFDEAAFEAERLRLDADARASTAAGADPRAWKWRIRKRVWDLLEAEGVARNPRPVHHRIPNFDGAAAAADSLGRLDVFQNAQCVKVNPDSPQKQVRFLTLSGDKKLLTPQPRLRTGFFSVLESQMVPTGCIPEACTSVGAAKYGRPIGLDEKIKVDLIVIGSVAVDPGSGARLGKGEGFAELEYGMLRYMGAIDDSTMTVTTVHDKQLVDDIPVEKLLIHDVPVDIICTPTQVILTNTAIPKPQGIYWEKLSPEKLGQIRILRELKRRIEQETGTVLPCGPSENLPPTAQRRRRRGR